MSRILPVITSLDVRYTESTHRNFKYLVYLLFCREPPLTAVLRVTVLKTFFNTARVIIDQRELIVREYHYGAHLIQYNITASKRNNDKSVENESPA